MSDNGVIVNEDVRLLDRALDMAFTSDAETAERLRRLVSALDLPYDNIAARWALSRSLTEGPLEQLPNGDQSHGKELRGRTLFGASDTAVLLVAGLVLVEGADRTNDALREVVLGHWRRGQSLLEADLQAALDDSDVLVKQGVERILGAQLHEVELSAEIVGQEELVVLCNEMLKQARDLRGAAGPVSLGQPVVLVGPRGSGRTYIATTLARALGGECILLNARRISSIADLRGELHDQIPGASAAVAIVEEIDHATPGLVRVLAKVAREGRIKPSKGAEICPFAVVAISGGNVVPAGWRRLDIAPYDRDAVAQVVRNHYGWHLEVRRLVALAGRLRPALALKRAKELAQIAGTPRVTDRHASLAMENWGLDRLGLDEVDRAVMTALASERSASLVHLSDTVRVGPARLADLILPYLTELGLIEEFDRSQWRPTSAGLDVYGDEQ